LPANPPLQRTVATFALRADDRRFHRFSLKSVAEHELSVDLANGRTIIVPLAWYPRLFHASASDRADWSAGFGIHWPSIDEDLSSEGLLRGALAPAYRKLGAA